jgi:hypothetical protein
LPAPNLGGVVKYIHDLNTKKQLLEILKWKSARPLRHYKANSEKEIKEITKTAFATKNDCLKLHILTALSGVNYPSASAILMFYDKKKYPVPDIRVWRQLYKLNLVKVNSRGQGFTIRQCEQYLKIIRDVSKKLNITARQTEKRLFDYDKNNQTGLLYGKQVKNLK